MSRRTRAERGIPMSGWSVNAIRRPDNPKTQTRRVVKLPRQYEGWRIVSLQYMAGDLYHAVLHDPRTGEGADISIRCPYGVPGDVLWCREALVRTAAGFCAYEADGCCLPGAFGVPASWPWKRPRLPSIFMPLWACRERLLLKAVRAERVQDASDEDIVAEGIDIGKEPYPVDMPECRDFDVDFAVAFREVWDSINAKRGHGWERNDLVWVLRFRRMEE